MGRSKVFFLFSLESILIGFWGAFLGIAGAILIGSIGNAYASKYFFESFEGYSLVAFKPLSLFSIMLSDLHYRFPRRSSARFSRQPSESD